MTSFSIVLNIKIRRDEIPYLFRVLPLLTFLSLSAGPEYDGFQEFNKFSSNFSPLAGIPQDLYDLSG